MKKLRMRQMYLQAIQIDHNPPAPPPTILDNGLYYERLQNLAFLTQKGQYAEVEKVLKNEEVVDEKNLYLKPLYRNLKKCIRFVSKTEEAQLTKEFKQMMAKVITSNIDDKEAALDKIRVDFRAKLREIRDRDSQPKFMLKKLESHITALFHLLITWIQYTDIIYCSEAMIKDMKYLRLNLDEANKAEAKEEREYFSKVLKGDKKEDELKYQTVEEGVTTDTGESADEGMETLRAEEAIGKLTLYH